MDLSVITVTHDGREMALATLRSAAARLGDLEAEWIVVDNASTDGTPEAIEAEFPHVRVVRAPNHGFAAGNNVALAHARGRYVLLVNPDVEIQQGTLRELVDALDARPEVGVASVLTEGPDGALLPTIRRLPTPARDLGEALGAARIRPLRGLQELDDRYEDYGRERSADWLVGSFLLARRAAVEEVGPLDDGFFLYSEEIDWCHRFRLAGWDVRHLPLMTITHHCGESDRPDLVAQLASSRLRFAYKHFSRRRAVAIHAALAFGHLLRLACFAPAAPWRPPLRRRARAEARGLAVLCGAAPPYAANPAGGASPPHAG
jgi:GT2 family glycosyltransferase